MNRKTGIAAATPAASAVATAELVPRHHPRFPAVLQVRLQTVDDLQLLFTRNVSKGGLFVGTSRDIPEGAVVKVSVIHPRTGEHFVLDAEVRWHAGATEPGVGLEFVKLTDQRRDEFLEFVCSEIPVEETIFVNDDRRHFSRPAPLGEPTSLAAPGTATASHR